MPPDARDPKYLWDMLDAARTVLRMTAGVSYDEYLQNRMMQLAVERGMTPICKTVPGATRLPSTKGFAQARVLDPACYVNAGLRLEQADKPFLLEMTVGREGFGDSGVAHKQVRLEEHQRR